MAWPTLSRSRGCRTSTFSLLARADLSSSLGLVGQYAHPEFLAAMDRIITAAASAGLPWGTVPIGRDYTRELVGRGCRMLELGSDIGTIWRGLESNRVQTTDLLSIG